ncbi:671_t:CDS:10 [Dentiscutata erythropus]|uniref:671_t:CDS:1 n=1 Tax=Dentiscutata erythropus TaxID=1348616 RepID=A0A9N9HE62_9GLOM|nr:671_t:CDS:10 [Dentiscutata erythropus]
MDDNEITVDLNTNTNEITQNFMEDENIGGLPRRDIDKKRENFLGIIGGAGYNINHIIGAGIFNPDNIWILVGSPAIILVFWILGGIISLIGTLIYIELGIRSLPKGIGEQRYIENAFPSKKNLGHIFSFVAIIIILPAAIIADTYACAQHLLYLFNINPDPKEYFDKDYIALRLLSILILAIITAYNMYSNRLSVIINQVLVFIKIIAIFLISIVGLIKLTGPNPTNWNEIYKSPKTYVGAYSSGILKVLFVYEGWNNINYTIEELQEPKDKKLIYSNLISVGVPFILYFLINVAFTTSLGHDFFIDESSFDQATAFNSNIALRFGYKLFDNNENGVKFMSAIIAISAFGCVGAMVFVYARIIKYAAATEFIPKYSHKFDDFHKKYGTPFNALFAQFIYCSVFLLFFFDPAMDLFDFFAETSQIIAMLFHGASAICLFILKKNTSITSTDVPSGEGTEEKNNNASITPSGEGLEEKRIFKIPKWVIVIYFILVISIVGTSFCPPGPGSSVYVLPYVVSIAATLLGGIIWKFRN